VCFLFSQLKPKYRDRKCISVQPQFAEGLPVKQVIIVMDKSGQKVLADSLETDAFYKAFQLKPGSPFRQAFADKAIQTINAQSIYQDFKLSALQLIVQ